MTREEAIAELNEAMDEISLGSYTYDGLERSIALEIGIKALEQEPIWIPVSERLPEIHNYMQEYIVTIKGNFIRIAFFTETNGKSWWSIDNVTAWMPLPKPYKLTDSEKE